MEALVVSQCLEKESFDTIDCSNLLNYFSSEQLILAVRQYLKPGKTSELRMQMMQCSNSVLTDKVLLKMEDFQDISQLYLHSIDHIESQNNVLTMIRKHQNATSYMKYSNLIVNLCNNCEQHGVTTSACSRCKVVKYCCKKCQKNDWKKHRMFCEYISSDEVKLSTIHKVTESSDNDDFAITASRLFIILTESAQVSFDIRRKKIVTNCDFLPDLPALMEYY